MAQDNSAPFVVSIGTAEGFLHVQNTLEKDFPFLKVALIGIKGPTTLKAENGGLRLLSIYKGKGEVFLRKGYRTQEGDGAPLPELLYETECIDKEFQRTLESILEKRDTLTEKARPPIEAILSRYSKKKNVFCGDIAGELWRLLEQSSRPWSNDIGTEKRIESLFTAYRSRGYSTKRIDSWEEIMAGDQLAVCGDEILEVRGEFSCFSIENIDQKTPHVSSVRRLVYLLDTAGGCSPGFDPFRRLPLTWLPNYPGEEADGPNYFNNHVVNIPEENSPTHFHPIKPIGGGLAQTEFYLVLDPESYSLSTNGLQASIVLYPDLKDLTKFEQYPLEPGMFVYIPPGTGHRGLNVFAAIMTIPGFKPGNELYLDRDIYERGKDNSPYNPAHLESKNYDSLDNFI